MQPCTIILFRWRVVASRFRASCGIDRRSNFNFIGQRFNPTLICEILSPA